MALDRERLEIAALTAVALTLLGCARREAPDFATAPAPTETSRHAPGVAVDPGSALPPELEQAPAERTVAVLREPDDVARAADVIAEYFDAVLEESLPRLEVLFDENARLVTGSRGQRHSVVASWQTRLKRLDYATLKGQLIYRASDLEVYRAREIDALRPSRLLPLRGRPGEVVVRVPIAATSRGAVQFFGDEVVFLLRPTREGYKIAEVYEDFRVP